MTSPILEEAEPRVTPKTRRRSEMSAAIVYYTETINPHVCPSCGVTYGLAQSFETPRSPVTPKD